MSNPVFYYNLGTDGHRVHLVSPTCGLEDVARLADAYRDVVYFASGRVAGFDDDDRCGDCGAWNGSDHRCPSRRHENRHHEDDYDPEVLSGPAYFHDNEPRSIGERIGRLLRPSEFNEGDAVLLKATVARSNNEQAFIEFTSMQGPFSIRVPLSELRKDT